MIRTLLIAALAAVACAQELRPWTVVASGLLTTELGVAFEDEKVSPAALRLSVLCVCACLCVCVCVCVRSVSLVDGARAESGLTACLFSGSCISLFSSVRLSIPLSLSLPSALSPRMRPYTKIESQRKRERGREREEETAGKKEVDDESAFSSRSFSLSLSLSPTPSPTVRYCVIRHCIRSALHLPALR